MLKVTAAIFRVSKNFRTFTVDLLFRSLSFRYTSAAIQWDHMADLDISCVRKEKALVRLCGCKNLYTPSLLNQGLYIKIRYSIQLVSLYSITFYDMANNWFIFSLNPETCLAVSTFRQGRWGTILSIPYPRFLVSLLLPLIFLKC